MIGKVFGRYRIVQKLGQGGMGEVWLAHDLSLDRRVALKFPSPVLEQDPAARKRFLKEARSAAALDHPYICSIHEVAEVEGKIFIAMEYVPGETLKEAIAAQKLSLTGILEITSEILQALIRAHAEGIVHRDLKPANIMLASNGHVKVMDFGLAKRIPTSDNAVTEASTASTEGPRYGTLAYMSPEQIRSEEIDGRSDIFSLGLVLYEMLSGRRPFDRNTAIESASAILKEDVPPIAQYRKDVSDSLARTLNKMLAKKKEDRHASAAELVASLTGEFAPPIRNRQRSVVAVAAALIVVAAVAAFGLNLWAKRNSRIRWARDEAIPEISRLANQEEYSAAFKILKDARLVIPADEKLESLWTEISTDMSVRTEPAGAEVYFKDYLDTSGGWERLGTTPLEKVRVSRGFKRFKVEEGGFETVDRALAVTGPVDLSLRLDTRGSLPEEMVRVPSSNTGPALTGIDPIERIRIDDFLIDRYEVTNKDYKKFVAAGGYQRSEFWKEPFIKDGRSLSWQEAMSNFRDATGRPGPSSWELGDYPKGQDDFPVTGVSWYEASAYAEFAGKRLPTVYHWVRAAGTQTAKFLIPLSRFGGSGPGAVTKSQAISVAGAYDVAGNVREWASNAYQAQRYILGGAWSDPTYLFNFAQVASPFDRSPANGFRCVKYTTTPASDVAGPIELMVRDYSKDKPVSDEIFQIYKQQFAYDRTALDAKVESKDETNEHWIVEKVTFRTAYGNERIIAYLTIPKAAKPPYQTVVHFPGSSAIAEPRLEGVPGALDFIVRSGRVLVSVAYKGTFERNDGIESTWPNMSHGYSDYVIKWVKDFKRTVDYLETRNDVDLKRLAYLGTSWGGRMGAIIPAVDERPRVSVIMLGGLAAGRARPEVDQINFITRVKIPVLMLNGKYDSLEPVASAQLPMFRMWGTPENAKRHVIYESNGHSVPRNESIRETLDWLDKYLGPEK
ncbi:MAG: protein kinase [Acidobacteria bacterium]|nr:protein kinase [Acidobacteriota bacterium]